MAAANGVRGGPAHSSARTGGSLLGSGGGGRDVGYCASRRAGFGRPTAVAVTAGPGEGRYFLFNPAEIM